MQEWVFWRPRSRRYTSAQSPMRSDCIDAAELLRHAEPLAKNPFAGRRKRHDPRSLLPPRPAEVERALQQRRSERSGQMMAAHAPIEACAAQLAARPCDFIDIDAEIAPERTPAPRYGQTVAGRFDQSTLRERIECEHAELPRQMIVANAREAKLGLARARPGTHCADAVRDAHQLLQKLAHVAICQTKVAMAALALHGD